MKTDIPFEGVESTVSYADDSLSGGCVCHVGRKALRLLRLLQTINSATIAIAIPIMVIDKTTAISTPLPPSCLVSRLTTLIVSAEEDRKNIKRSMTQ